MQNYIGVMDMQKKYKYAVIIGRFQPVHNAHIKLMETGLEVAEKILIVLGSANSLQTIKNPFTIDQRKEMILSCFDQLLHNRIVMTEVEDSIYSDPDWVIAVETSVKNASIDVNNKEITIIAHDKDETTYYLNMFKQWKPTQVESIKSSIDGPPVSATKIRELLFEGYLNLVGAVCPQSVVNWLNVFSQTEEFKYLREEYNSALEYDLQYENIPYGQVNFVTVDSLVVQSGHVLLVQRGVSPYPNSWALPGGHLNINETFLEGAIRELKEETQIKVPDKVLKGSLVYERIFDHPDRSLRGRTKRKIGRTITKLHVFKLDDSIDLPRVVGSDDAKKAWFFTFAEVKAMRSQMFEDHWDMIMHALNRI